jgi:hypothetical protein
MKVCKLLKNKNNLRVIHRYACMYIYILYIPILLAAIPKNHWTPPPTVPKITRQGAENHDLLVAQSLAASSRTASWRTLNERNGPVVR